jgi:hypothetical protein
MEPVQVLMLELKMLICQIMAKFTLIDSDVSQLNLGQIFNGARYLKYTSISNDIIHKCSPKHKLLPRIIFLCVACNSDLNYFTILCMFELCMYM